MARENRAKKATAEWHVDGGWAISPVHTGGALELTILIEMKTSAPVEPERTTVLHLPWKTEVTR